ncbi:NAD(P)H-hydrate dehydratase [Carboxydocella sp. ULO1]|uniref:NAD(P)H-hydrate dehydratase n=3 Tax=unclassified Carboxydocella TaxID=2685367 RepID=UPI0009AD0397|nr:NAD(P)H-hydrate dehydratase [Carboxydocella sp. ULO1]GAW28931.1 bifunctional ADP-dependent (S)-NAD(P)H-hydrate dehydratase/NAD(P)H-hydrate epimerase [Carboxydocella sp. ULO1]
MLVLKPEEMRQLDQLAIKKLGIPGAVLMENAGVQVVQAVEKLLGELRGKRATILVGKGNNGGDGLVVARHLLNRGMEVKTLLLAAPEEIRGDARLNLEILHNLGYKVHYAGQPSSLNTVKVALLYTDIIIDAIYGTGFQGSVPEYIGQVINLVNDSGKPIVAVDIPSGVEGASGHVHGPAIKATATVTMAYPKVGLVVEPGASFCGQLLVADISIPAVLEKEVIARRQLLQGELVASWLPRRAAEGHKGTYGKVVVVAGSRNMSGAAVLATLGALHGGAGLVEVIVPRSLQDRVAVAVPAALTRGVEETPSGTLAEAALEEITAGLAGAQAVVIGPGLGQEEETGRLFRQVLERIGCPTVIDADGLNYLAAAGEKLQLPPGTILTPHPGEMARLTGLTTAEVQKDRLAAVERAWRNWQAVIVLKGARTLIAAGENCYYFNPTGNPGMATGGSGDVLAGLIGALLAQGLSPEQAAAAGAWLHGRAGDLAREEMGELALTALDVVNYLRKVSREIWQLGGSKL